MIGDYTLVDRLIAWALTGLVAAALVFVVFAPSGAP